MRLSDPRGLTTEGEFERLRRIFRPTWYLMTNPDVSQAGLDPWNHFRSGGLFEDRAPNPLFQPLWYRARGEVPADIPAIVHYLRSGPLNDVAPSILFHPAWYRQQAADSIVGSTLLEDYQSRTIHSRISPHPLFWTAWYVERSGMDGSEALSPLEHYLTFGWRRRISPSPFFSPGLYERLQNDVESSGLEPLTHFVESARLDGAERTASLFFDSRSFDERSFAEIQPSPSETIRSDLILDDVEGEALVVELGNHLLRANRRAEKFFTSLMPKPSSSQSKSTDRVRIAWLERARSLQLPAPVTPLVSIVIPTHNHAHDVVRCIESIVSAGDATPYEIVVVDDCSSNDEHDVLTQIRGIRLIRNASNVGFAQACRNGIAVSHGDYLLLLNDDTEVLSGWLDALISTMNADTTIGLVGSMVLHYDFLLQEAGCIVFSDASARQYGRDVSPLDRRYRRTRDVDYCSGCCLMVSRRAWDAVDGFDRQFDPAYYEDTDLSFALRHEAFRTVYEPRSVVLHREGMSYEEGGSSKKSALMAQNRRLFREKWRAVLSEQHEPTDEIDEIVWPTPAIVPDAKLVLVVAQKVPNSQSDSGSLRQVGVIREFIRQGRQVFFLPLLGQRIGPEVAELEELGVNVFYEPLGSDRLGRLLRRHRSNLECVWVSRPECAAAFLSDYLAWFPEVPYVYDTVDAHTLRLQRQFAIEGLTSTDELARTMQRYERTALRTADVVVTLSDADSEAFRVIAGIGFREVRVPNVHPDVPSGPVLDQRHGLLFVGSYVHEPNVDAAEFFVTTILPLIRSQLGPVQLTLAGSDPPSRVLALRGEGVEVPGWQPSLEAYYHQARVVVAPLRYGAGVKGKIGEAMSFGVPIVTTSIGAEGMELSPGLDVEIADDPEEFAHRVVALYNDEDRWRAMSAHAKQVVREHYGTAAMSVHIEELLRTVADVRLI